MKKNINFLEYLYRASQSSKLKTGAIGLSDSQKATLSKHLKRKNGFEADKCDENGKPYKALTENMKKEMELLLEQQKNPSLPKTLTSELKKIYRAEKYNRNFAFTNKYVQKGINEEDEAITVYQKWLKATKGVNRLFTKNTERHFGKYFQGEPDIAPFYIEDGIKCGVDTKCSWSLDTFPFADEPLVDQYESQNQVYMSLTSSQVWVTAYVLVNASEDAVFKEKMKWFYALKDKNGTPDDEDHKNYNEYIKKCKEVEKMLIFDYDRFMQVNPGALLDYTRKEWMEEGNDIPLEDRVVEKVSTFNESFISDLEKRAIIGRKFMNDLD